MHLYFFSIALDSIGLNFIRYHTLLYLHHLDQVEPCYSQFVNECDIMFVMKILLSMFPDVYLVLSDFFVQYYVFF